MWKEKINDQFYESIDGVGKEEYCSLSCEFLTCGIFQHKQLMFWLFVNLPGGKTPDCDTQVSLSWFHLLWLMRRQSHTSSKLFFAFEGCNVI